MPVPPKIKLDHTRIRSLNFKIKDEPGKEEVEISFSISYGYHYDYSEKRIIVTIYVSIDQDEMPFVLDIEYQGLFLLKKRVAKKQIEPFAKVNCPAILFPFLRECIADITRRAGLNPLILPAVNFVELAKKQEVPKKKRSDSK